VNDQIVIILPSLPGGEALWGRFDNGKLAASGRERLDRLRIAKAASDIIAVLPGQSVRVHGHELPQSSKKDRIKAAGFSIEDKLASGLDGVHVALGDNGDKRIAVIDKADLNKVLDALAAADLRPKHIYSDFDILSLHDEPLQVLDRIVTPGPFGHAVDANWPQATEGSRALSETELLELVAHGAASAQLIDLRQQEFKQAGGSFFKTKVIAQIAALAACAGLAGLLFHGMEARTLSLQAEDIKFQTAQNYQRATGQSAPSNPALAITRQLQSQAGDNRTFLRLSSVLFQSVARVDGLSVDRLQFQKDENALQLRLVYPSFESASEFERAVKSLGGQVITGGVREQGGKFIGEATLSGAGS